MKIDIKINDKKVLQVLNLLAYRGDDLSSAMRAIAGVLADKELLKKYRHCTNPTTCAIEFTITVGADL